MSVRSKPGLKIKDPVIGDWLDAPDFVTDLSMACPFPNMTDAEEVIAEYAAHGLTEHLIFNRSSNAEMRGVSLDVYSQAEFDRLRIERELANGG